MTEEKQYKLDQVSVRLKLCEEPAIQCRSNKYTEKSGGGYEGSSPPAGQGKCNGIIH